MVVWFDFGLRLLWLVLQATGSLGIKPTILDRGCGLCDGGFFDFQTINRSGNQVKNSSAKMQVLWKLKQTKHESLGFKLKRSYAFQNFLGRH